MTPTSSPLILVEGRHGRFLTFRGDRGVSLSLQLLGEYSEDELGMIAMVLSILRRNNPRQEIVEAGAYIGDMTIPLSRLVHHIHAFEPQQLVREVLEENLRLNHITNVTVYPYALGEKEGMVYINPADCPDSPGSRVAKPSPSGGEEGVRMITLDSLNLSPSFIKADVEGMEVSLLRGAGETLTRSHPILFMERDTVPTSPSITSYIRSLNYTAYDTAFYMWRNDNFKGCTDTTHFGTTASFMVLGTPQ
jgi:FkbM family methyltransferase